MTESNVSCGLNEVVRNNIVKIIETKDLKVSDLERKSKFRLSFKNCCREI